MEDERKEEKSGFKMEEKWRAEEREWRADRGRDWNDRRRPDGRMYGKEMGKESRWIREVSEKRKPRGDTFWRVGGGELGTEKSAWTNKSMTSVGWLTLIMWHVCCAFVVAD